MQRTIIYVHVRLFRIFQLLTIYMNKRVILLKSCMTKYIHHLKQNEEIVYIMYRMILAFKFSSFKFSFYNMVVIIYIFMHFIPCFRKAYLTQFPMGIVGHELYLYQLLLHLDCQQQQTEFVPKIYLY
jgi:hypothetical protein